MEILSVVSADSMERVIVQSFFVRSANYTSDDLVYVLYCQVPSPIAIAIIEDYHKWRCSKTVACCVTVESIGLPIRPLLFVERWSFVVFVALGTHMSPKVYCEQVS